VRARVGILGLIPLALGQHEFHHFRVNHFVDLEQFECDQEAEEKTVVSEE